MPIYLSHCQNNYLELVGEMTAEEFVLCLCRSIHKGGTTADNAKQYEVAKSTLNKAVLMLVIRQGSLLWS